MSNKKIHKMTYPILYTFRRCPYAIRARMALWYSGVGVKIREVILKNKPQAMLAASAKGTVPILVLENGSVIDESLDIMHYALHRSDPEGWLNPDHQQQSDQLITANDNQFKPLLDNYKYPQNTAKQDPAYYREQSRPFLQSLNHRLIDSLYLFGQHINIADVALFPFIRQFAMVDPDWFNMTAYTDLQRWLQAFLDSDLFQAVMQKYQPWQGQDEPIGYYYGK